MPRLRDPSRAMLANGRLCWKDSLVALPSLELLPSEVQEALLARLLVGGCWYHFSCQTSALPWLWRQWEEDPERVAVELFGAELPRGVRWQAPRQVPDGPEELGL